MRTQSINEVFFYPYAKTTNRFRMIVAEVLENHYGITDLSLVKIHSFYVYKRIKSIDTKVTRIYFGGIKILEYDYLVNDKKFEGGKATFWITKNKYRIK